MAKTNKQLSDAAQESSRSSISLSTSQTIAAIVTILIGLVAAGWGTYAVFQQQAQSPKHLMNQCRNSIKRIESSLSKTAA